MSLAHRLLALAMCAAGLNGCGNQTTDPAAVAAVFGAPRGVALVYINGEAITEPMLVVFAKGRGLDPTQAQQRQQALDALIENVVLAQQAIRSGLVDRPEVQAELTLVRLQQLAGRSLAEHRQKLQISDGQIANLYQQEAQRAGPTEWRTEHLLFASEVEAKIALDRALAPGADFAALISEYAQGTAKQAKALDWSNASQLPEELVTALKQLEDGQTAPIPVKTGFGWHVLRRVEARPFNPPPLGQVKDGARKQLTEVAVKEFVAGLRAAARLEGTTTSAGGQIP